MRYCFFTFLFLTFLSIQAFSQINEEWAADERDKTSMTNAVTCVDAFGYIYVAGTYTDTSTAADWIIVKYTPAGNKLWTKTYDGGNSGDDFVHAITIDRARIYVTGSMFGSNGDDYSTMGFDYDGNLIWSVTYDGPARGSDIAHDIKVDASGNVFVTGESEGSSTGKDIATIKYNSSGTQVWVVRYDGSASDDDNASVLAVDGGGNVIVAGYSINSSSNKDAITIKYTNSGTQSWTNIFNGSTNEEDYASAITIDANDNLYIAGKTTNSTELSNYLIIKYKSSGSTEWISTYDGPARNEDRANDIVFSDGFIYTTGESKGSSGGITTYDYATIKYDLNGVLKWLQRYNGPANGDDKSIAIIADYTGDIVITGSSNDTTGYDYLTVAYDTSGSSLWLERYSNPNYSNDDMADKLAADDMGNIYVTGASYSSSSMLNLTTVKYADVQKNTDVIRGKLEMLAVGLLNESQNDTIKNIVNVSCALSVDSFYFIRYDSLIARVEREGLPLKTRMNSRIASYYSISASDYVGDVLSTLWVRGELRPAFLSIPNYIDFVGTSVLMSNPKLAYGYEENDYPISCINCSGSSQITRSQTAGNLTYLVLVNFPSWSQAKVWKYLTNCVAQVPDLVSLRCQVCGGFPSPGGINIGSGNTLMNHEIEIDIGSNGVNGSDGCLFIDGLNNTPATAYAKLSKITGFNYYTRVGSTPDYRRLQKLIYPIEDRNYLGNGNPEQGDVLSLCEDVSKFNSWDEHTSGIRYALGMGGVFKLERPGTSQQPLYFSFPYATGLWFNQGPDMRVFYGTVTTTNTCLSGRQEITQMYETHGCEFCGYYPVWNIASTDVTNYLASTDYNFISNYWKDNVINVGVLTSASVSALNSNLLEFTAGTTGSCTPPTTTPKAQLLLLNDGTYEYIKKFTGNQSYAPGTNLTVHVRANFANNEYIDECQTLTLAANANNYTLIVVQIRGDIKNYSSSVINYQVDIY